MKFKIFILFIFMHFCILPAGQGKFNYIKTGFSLSYNYDSDPGIPAPGFFFSAEDDSSIIIKSSNPVKEKNLKRAILVNAAIWVAGSVNYWRKYSAWIEDWQYQLKWKDQKIRFFSLKANKFDSNPFQTNWTHGLSGALYYNIARYYRLSVWDSLLFGAATSLVWEYVTEWREVISLNDNFFTGIGSLPLGEPFFQLGKYLLSKKGLLNHIGGYVLNPVFGLNDLLGGKKWRSNFSGDYFSSPGFTLSLSNENVRFKDGSKENGNRFHLNIASVFRQIPGYGLAENKRVNLSFASTFYTSVDFGLSIGNGKIEEYLFNTKVIYLGFFDQKIMKTERGKLEGYSFFLGASSAYTFYKKRALEEYDTGEYHYNFSDVEEDNDNTPHNFDENLKPPLPVNFTDKMAVINLIGPTAELTLYSSPFELKITADAYFDFGLINSFALNRYSEKIDIFQNRMKTTLSYYGYHYAFGYTLNLGTGIKTGNLYLNGSYKYQSYASIQGLDRFQDRIRDDNKVYDSRSILSGSINYRIPRSSVSFSLFIHKYNRKGTLNSVTANEKETKIFSSLNLHF